MNRLTILMILSICGLFIGCLMIAYGVLFDPFSIPFQDYDQMPKETQQKYEAESRAMSQLVLAGLCVTGAAGAGMIIGLVVKFVEKNKNGG